MDKKEPKVIEATKLGDVLQERQKAAEEHFEKEYPVLYGILTKEIKSLDDIDKEIEKVPHEELTKWAIESLKNEMTRKFAMSQGIMSL